MEVELKLLFAPDDLGKVLRSRALAETPHGKPRSARVHSVYYDTRERDLYRHGVALRLRHHGRLWLQALKGGDNGVAGLSSREEFEWPLEKPALQLGLLKETPYKRLFRKKLRERLEPVLETDFQRRSVQLEFENGGHAELALDRGEIRAGRRSEPLCEVEIELTAGDSQGLFALADRLLDEVPFRVGMLSKAERGYSLLDPVLSEPRKARPIELEPGMPAADAFLALVQACTEHARANEDGFLNRDDPEYLHQLRVGLRRLRAVLTVPREDAWRAALAPLQSELKWLWRSLGEARNWDVVCDEIIAPLARHERSAGLERLRRRAERMRRRHVGEAREAVRSARYQRVWLALARLCDAHARGIARGMNAIHMADAVLDRRYRKVCRWGGPLPTAPEAMHRLRIEAKKLRYLAQLLSPMYGGKQSKSFLQSLSALQDVLGTLNDAAVSTHVIEQAASVGEQLDREAVGLASGWVAARSEEARLALPGAWQHFAGRKLFWS